MAAWNRRAPAPAPTDAEIDAIADQHKASGYGTVWPHAFARAILAKWGAQPVAAPEGPVARIEGIDEYGPRLEWTQHWVDVGVGAKLYTASQVQAMRHGSDAALKSRLLTALERASLAECALRALIDECESDSIPGWEDRMNARINAGNAMLAAVPRNAPLYSPDDVAFPARHGADALPPELVSTARPASTAAEEVTSVPIKAGEYPPLVCDYCGALTPDPWHSSGMLHGKMSKHIHSCDSCVVEAEVRGQDEALIRQMHGALVSLAQWMVAEVEHFDGATPDAWIIDSVNAALAASRARLESKP